MNLEHTKPFIEAIKNIFSGSFELEVEAGEPFPSKDKAEFLDISAMIGFAGDIKGSIILSFIEEDSIKMSKKFCGLESTEVDEIVTDAIGEILNIIAGNAKQGFTGYQVNISVPNVVRKNIVVVVPDDALFVTIPFKTSLFSFNLTLALIENK